MPTDEFHAALADLVIVFGVSVRTYSQGFQMRQT